jgi:hypothetical protein
MCYYLEVPANELRLWPLGGLTKKGEGANEGGAKFTLAHQSLHHVFGIKGGKWVVFFPSLQSINGTQIHWPYE